MELVCSDAHYPDKQNLRAHFLAAELTDFCDCGCNSFKVRIPTGISLLPLAKPGGGGAFFDCAFFLEDGTSSLEIILFVDERGYLSYVEVDFCGNSGPAPEVLSLQKSPYHVYASDSLLLRASQ